MRRLLALVRTDVSEEHITPIIRVTRTEDLVTMLAVTCNRGRLPEYITCGVILRNMLRLQFLLKFLARRFLSTWWWRRYVPPKHRFLRKLHVATSQETAFLKDIAGFCNYIWDKSWRCVSNVPCSILRNKSSEAIPVHNSQPGVGVDPRWSRLRILLAPTTSKSIRTGTVQRKFEAWDWGKHLDLNWQGSRIRE
jgi:hypothetical protein